MAELATSCLANPDAERSVLGAIFVKPDRIYELSDLLKPDDFYRQDYRLVYGVMLEMAQERRPIDLVTVTETLRQAGKLDAAGGFSLIADLANAVPTAAHMKHHAASVAEYSKRRKAAELGAILTATASDVTKTLEPGEFQEKLAALMLEKADAPKTMQESILSFYSWLEYASKPENAGIKSGLSELDAKTQGFRPSELIVIAARPGMGKTALALTIAMSAAASGKKCAFFSLEMSREQIMTRIMSAVSKVNNARIMTPQVLSDDEYAKLCQASNLIAAWPLFIEDRACVTPLSIMARARQIQGKYGLDAIFIDYLQLMQGGGKFSRSDNRTSEVSFISRSLKLMAKELNVPVIALSQLNRNLESRADKRPTIADLRESGGIEQDADQILLMFSERYYDKTNGDELTEINLAKNRRGQTGIAKIKFVPSFTNFIDA